MAPSDSRGSDRSPMHYAVKTSKRPQLKSSHSHHAGHSYSVTHSHRAAKSTSSPLASPRHVQSVGQAYPPKLSPSLAPPARSQQHQQQAQPPNGPGQSPSYFNLGIDSSPDFPETSNFPRENWSPPTSSIKSFGAALPKQVPLDANPEFEAFRRQADAHRGHLSFNLGSSHLGNQPLSTPSSGTPEYLRPGQPRSHTFGSDSTGELSLPRFPLALPTKNRESRDPSSSRMDVDTDSIGSSGMHDSAYVSADSKRSSEASLHTPSFLDGIPRNESPAQFDLSNDLRSPLSKVEDRHPRLSLAAGKAEPPGWINSNTRRAETDPSQADAGGPAMMTPAQLRDLMDSVTPQSPFPHSSLLLLDLRVSPQFAQARIQGALNLCIPTTLLKRATFNLAKLQQTFQNETDQQRFSSWKRSKYLIVYDAASSEKRDATSAINMLKKFTNEGYEGAMYILSGGFNGFAAAYPDMIEKGCSPSSGGASGTLSLNANSGLGRPSFAPVVGGVILPTASNNPNPFFSNIRQNMDLADGVGQMDVSLPRNLDWAGLPRWLREASEPSDHGKRVSDKFLHIELTEQARMKNAYSVFNPATAAKAPGYGMALQQQRRQADIQLSGLEKGGKNRYKDILPFEHARVRLHGKPEGACDYVNASHVKASRSHKRYIASQGPLPATFEDFWSVIWDQDVRVIVMLTAESEGGQLKCHPYWMSKDFGPIKLRSLSEKRVSLDIDKYRSNSTISPVSTNLASARERAGQGNSFPFGPATAELGRRRANTVTSVTADSTTPTPAQPNPPSNGASGAMASGETPYVIIRKFAVSHAAHPFAPIREITHLHYPSWPDFGAPAQPSHLLALVELANVMQRASLPIDVPSAIASAGVDSSSSRRGSLKSSSLGSNGGNSNSQGPSKTDPIPITWHDEPEADARARPVLVHCSAGCGRTGTFCAVDSVIDMLKRQRLQAVKKANERLAAREEKMQAQRKMMMARRDADVSMCDDVDEDMIAPDECFDFSAGAGADDNEDEDGDSISPLSGLPVMGSGSASAPPKALFFPRHNSTSTTASSDNTGASGRSSITSRTISTTASISVGTSGAGDATREEEVDQEDQDQDESELDLSFLEDESVDLIALTVEDFRTQRLSMVQSLRQFVLCYETIVEWIWRLQERGGGAGVGSDRVGGTPVPATAAASVSPFPGGEGGVAGLAVGSAADTRARARSGTFTG